MNRILESVFIALISIFTLLTATSCEEVKSNHFIIACESNAEPFAYLDSEGKLTGLEIELIQAIAIDQNFDFKFKQMEFSQIITAIQTKRPGFDGAVALVTWTADRMSEMDFSHPYFTSQIAAAVRPGSYSIGAPKDLAGKKVVAKQNTLIYKYVEMLRDTIGFTLTGYETVDDAFGALVNGSADVVVEELPLITYRIGKGAEIELAYTFRQKQLFSLIVKKEKNAKLLDKFNAGIDNLKADGTYDSIVKKYFPNLYK